MGQTYSSLMKYFFAKPERNILLYGLGAVGKTSIFNKMQLDEQTYPMPMPDVCEGMKDMKIFRFYFLDVARRLTACYKDNFFMNNINAVIFVVDSTDSNSIDEVNETLNYMLSSEELKNVFFIIFANKQDLPNTLSPTEVAEKIKVQERKRICHIQGTSGLTGDGVLEGVEYLHSLFQRRRWFNIL
ncbi:uncharacterized protein LOC129941374 [Eupeodes corollae]|uniref:uncharacterized protein LOC129941374 n=1 Tax=Eupeodes corollae TaxID=290404 RepID=UPI002490EDDB|nr:uncharacterized protein LOC129941374 [Eupeodes corollae]